MNLTRLIEETGRRFRLGKPVDKRLTNAEIKEVLETAIDVLKDALIQEGRIEIQHFAVIEVRQINIASEQVLVHNDRVKQVIETNDKHIRWQIRPAQAFKNRFKE